MNYKITKEEKLFLILYTVSKLCPPIITRIQKTLFIYCKEYEPNLLFYVPNNFGANSFELTDQLTFLETNNFVYKENNENIIKYKISSIGKKMLSNQKLLKKYEHKLYILNEIIIFSNSLKHKLVDYVYAIYPKYTEKSLIIESIMGGMSNDRKRDAKQSIFILRKKIQESKNN